MLPVFQHTVDDTKTFHLIASQFYVNGNATQAEICRAFGVTFISLKRAVKLYREKGAAGFYEIPKRRGAVVLTPAVLEQAQQLLSNGADISEVAEQLTIKADTLRKAVTAGKLHKPVKKKDL
jgi:transposase-like protein